MRNTKNLNSILVFSFIIICLSYIFAFSNPPQMLDKSIIYDPLYNLSSYSDYFTLIKEGKSVDLQPVRDISLLTDIFIGKSLGFENFPLITNILILLITGFLLNKILYSFFSEKFSEISTLIFLIHPTTLMIYVEFSSRKHILSFLFFLIAYLFFLKDRLSSKKTYFIGITSYVLSLLSQPINAGLPLLLFLHDGFDKNKLKSMFLKMIPFGLCFIAIGILNLWYYHNTNLQGEFFVEYGHNFRRIFLGINLYFRQFFLPISFSYGYNLESFFNIYSAIIPLTLIAFIAKNFRSFSEDKKKAISRGTLLIFIIFLTLYIPKTNIINTVFQNYYILTPALGLIFIMGGIFKSFSISRMFAGVLLFSFVTYSISINSVYHSKRDNVFNLIKYFSTQEDGCYPFQYVATESIRVGKKKLFLEYAKKWADMRCIVILEEYLYARVLINTFRILYSDDFTFKEKEALFANKFVSPYDFIAIMSILLYENDKIDYSFKYFEQLKDFDEPSIFYSHTYYGIEFDNLCKEKEEEERSLGCKTYLDYRDRVKDKESSIGYRKNL